MFAERDKHYPSRSGSTSLATAVTNITKPVTKINIEPSKSVNLEQGSMMYLGTTQASSLPTWRGWPKMGSSWRAPTCSQCAPPPGQPCSPVTTPFTQGDRYYGHSIHTINFKMTPVWYQSIFPGFCDQRPGGYRAPHQIHIAPRETQGSGISHPSDWQVRLQL